MLTKQAQSIVNQLIKLGLKIATAESCTGGMVSQYLTAVSGASSVFEYGIVSYANRIKEKELEVNVEDLRKYGAVSEQVCVQMARGVLKKAEADIGVSVTGIAGPTGGTAQKPVGTVYIAVASKKKLLHKKLSLSGNRNAIRKQTVNQVFLLLEELIEALDS